MSDGERWTLLVDRYLAGECSPQELLTLKRLLESDAALRAYLTAVRPWWRFENFDATPDVERALASVKQSLGRAPKSRPSPMATPVTRSRLRVVPYAIAVALAGAAAVWMAMVSTGHRNGMAAPSAEFATAAGQRSRVTLPDGSRVVLAPRSRLWYQASGANARQLTLEGEAYFEVRHDPSRPFRVTSGRVITEDIGTSFVIDAASDDGDVNVSVFDGRVAVRGVHSDRPAILLHAGNAAGIDSRGDSYRVADQDPGDSFSWSLGALRLHEAALSRVAKEISNWYGVDVRCDDPALSRVRLTVSVGDVPLPQLLATIAHVAHARVTTRGSVFLISPWGIQ